MGAEKFNAVDVSGLAETGIVYSFASLVTDLDEYKRMVKAFADVGFGISDCEFLFVDNSHGNVLEAFAAYNVFLQKARGRYIVLCHQDVLPLREGRIRLDMLLKELDGRDPNWGLCGNAGGTSTGQRVIRISDPNRQDQNQGGPFPAQVMSLDENFIVVRKDANLALSRNLSGYHWYGADLCLIAEILGWNSYVIDFHLHHKSGGTWDRHFDAVKNAFADKYAHAFRSRWQHATIMSVYISSSPIQRIAARAMASLQWRFRKGVLWCRAQVASLVGR